ncbi:Muscle-specific protein 20 [Amphibalanus amphitrite]|uniref:Muscle-specific protein 20 n=1 Tax=Amphibalanus amphitrite TaxID=1232801 RepID=A0A6A4W6E2_AMPAM|nr:muscle-specific protein 20-like [Amphibalanus amphitrite]XP_043199661.1 muscle-specific protein 20-like [Amphibalanus amphitrite]KAF0302896.1 Muscle-specific protein 20 [Amphibalanus amphitrite]
MPWIFGGRDKAQEEEVQRWIETVTGEQWPAGVPYSDFLRDGEALCKLMNSLSPGCIKRINTSGSSFNYMDNIHSFLRAAVAYGVADVDLFEGSDLLEGRNIERVTRAIQAVARQAHRHPEYRGPLMGPRPAQPNVRHFDEQTLAAGSATLTQQTGYNRGATQAGLSFGKPRRIIIGK